MEMEYYAEIKNICLKDAEYKNFRYVILNRGTHPCCYVDIATISEDMGPQFKKNVSNSIRCHGNITYTDNYLTIESQNVSGQWIGWDYMHAGDYTPGVSEDGHKYTLEELETECRDVIDQLNNNITDKMNCKSEFTHKEVLDRFHIISAMNEIMRAMNNEDAYMEWIYTCPDEASEDDLLDIAQSDEMMKDCEEEFFRIIKKYGDDGLFYYQKFHM